MRKTFCFAFAVLLLTAVTAQTIDLYDLAGLLPTDLEASLSSTKITYPLDTGIVQEIIDYYRAEYFDPDVSTSKLSEYLDKATEKSDISDIEMIDTVTSYTEMFQLANWTTATTSPALSKSAYNLLNGLNFVYIQMQDGTPTPVFGAPSVSISDLDLDADEEVGIYNPILSGVPLVAIGLFALVFVIIVVWFVFQTLLLPFCCCCSCCCCKPNKQEAEEWKRGSLACAIVITAFAGAGCIFLFTALGGSSAILGGFKEIVTFDFAEPVFDLMTHLGSSGEGLTRLGSNLVGNVTSMVNATLVGFGSTNDSFWEAIQDIAAFPTVTVIREGLQPAIDLLDLIPSNDTFAVVFDTIDDINNITGGTSVLVANLTAIVNVMDTKEDLVYLREHFDTVSDFVDTISDVVSAATTMNDIIADVAAIPTSATVNANLTIVWNQVATSATAASNMKTGIFTPNPGYYDFIQEVQTISDEYMDSLNAFASFTGFDFTTAESAGYCDDDDIGVTTDCYNEMMTLKGYYDAITFSDLSGTVDVIDDVKAADLDPFVDNIDAILDLVDLDDTLAGLEAAITSIIALKTDVAADLPDVISDIDAFATAFDALPSFTTMGDNVTSVVNEVTGITYFEDLATALERFNNYTVRTADFNEMKLEIDYLLANLTDADEIIDNVTAFIDTQIPIFENAASAVQDLIDSMTGAIGTYILTPATVEDLISPLMGIPSLLSTQVETVKDQVASIKDDLNITEITDSIDTSIIDNITSMFDDIKASMNLTEIADMLRTVETYTGSLTDVSDVAADIKAIQTTLDSISTDFDFDDILSTLETVKTTVASIPDLTSSKTSIQDVRDALAGIPSDLQDATKLSNLKSAITNINGLDTSKFSGVADPGLSFDFCVSTSNCPGSNTFLLNADDSADPTVATSVSAIATAVAPIDAVSSDTMETLRVAVQNVIDAEDALPSKPTMPDLPTTPDTMDTTDISSASSSVSGVDLTAQRATISAAIDAFPDDSLVSTMDDAIDTVSSSLNFNTYTSMINGVVNLDVPDIDSVLSQLNQIPDLSMLTDYASILPVNSSTYINESTQLFDNITEAVTTITTELPEIADEVQETIQDYLQSNAAVSTAASVLTAAQSVFMLLLLIILLPTAVLFVLIWIPCNNCINRLCRHFITWLFLLFGLVCGALVLVSLALGSTGATLCPIVDDISVIESLAISAIGEDEYSYEHDNVTLAINVSQVLRETLKDQDFEPSVATIISEFATDVFNAKINVTEKIQSLMDKAPEMLESLIPFGDDDDDNSTETSMDLNSNFTALITDTSDNIIATVTYFAADLVMWALSTTGLGSFYESFLNNVLCHGILGGFAIFGYYGLLGLLCITVAFIISCCSHPYNKKNKDGLPAEGALDDPYYDSYAMDPAGSMVGVPPDDMFMQPGMVEMQPMAVSVQGGPPPPQW